MTRSELLRDLFAAYSRGDDQAFQRSAAGLIAGERDRKHHLVAAQLEHALHRDRRPGGPAPLSMRPIPKARDDRPLLTLTKPRYELAGLVLDPSVSDVVYDVVEENHRRATLTGAGLAPRQRMLFVGPPGTGKSACGHAIADELSRPVATANLATLSSSFLGDTARNVEAVIRFAEQTPCVLLLDEVDVLAQERGERHDHGEIRRVAAAVLQMIDELRGESLVVATSNHPRLLDSALWRRFDEVVPFPRLGTDGIADLIGLRLRAVEHRVSVRQWADRLQSCTPAEVELICLDAMRRAVVRDADLDDEVLASSVARFDARRAVMDGLAE